MNDRLAKSANVHFKYEVKVRLLTPKEYCCFLFQKYQSVKQMFCFLQYDCIWYMSYTEAKNKFSFEELLVLLGRTHIVYNKSYHDIQTVSHQGVRERGPSEARGVLESLGNIWGVGSRKGAFAFNFVVIKEV